MTATTPSTTVMRNPPRDFRAQDAQMCCAGEDQLSVQCKMSRQASNQCHKPPIWG